MQTSATQLKTIQERCRASVQRKFLSAHPLLVEANTLATGIIGSLLLRANGKIGELNDSALKRAPLCSSFIMGMNTCADTIIGGFYLQAAALLRQEMETAAALGEISQGTWKDKKVPNVKVLNGTVRRLYADLSSATHVSSHTVLRLNTEHREHNIPETAIWRLSPEFDEKLSKRLYSLHIYFILLIIEHMDSHFEELYDVACDHAENEAFGRAINLLIETKCFL
jgi:hypothetical protein